MPETPDILAIGEQLIEMVKVPETVSGRPAFVQSFGGDTSTVMIAAARQGGRTGYLTAISDDMFGQAFQELWAEEGVDVSFCPVRKGDPTGVCFIDPDPSGRKFSYARRGSASSLYSPSDLPEGGDWRGEGFACFGHQLGDQRKHAGGGFAGD